MHPGFINIGIIEPSDLLFEGLVNILLKHRPHLRFYRIDELLDSFKSPPNISIDTIIINPAQVQNRIKQFRTLKIDHPEVRWIGMVYSLVSSETLTDFDEIIRIDERSEDICRKIIDHKESNTEELAERQQKILSLRELDVLRFLSNGLSNKEIANKLNISIHTVISHRKNITRKTGIKSESGLTIYALSNNIISLDNI
jgi:DNA-binding CsgD family transcriptional regulator